MSELRIFEVPLEMVLSSAVDPPRKLLDSIAQVGQIVPVIAVQEGDFWHVIDGRRRVACLRILEASHVKAIPCMDEFEAQRAITALAANVHSPNKVGEARLLRELGVESWEVLDEETRRAIGLTAPEVRERLKLAGLSQSVLDMVDGGELAVSAAKELAKVPRRSDVRVLKYAQDEVGEGKRLTTRSVRNAVRKVRGELQPQLPVPIPGAAVVEASGPDPVMIAAMLRELFKDPAVLDVHPTEWQTVIDDLEAMA